MLAEVKFPTARPGSSLQTRDTRYSATTAKECHIARRATIGAMKNRPAAKMRRTNWGVEAGFSGRAADFKYRETLR